MRLLRLTLVLVLITAGLPPTALADQNEPPLADAGLDQEVDEGSVVYLDGGGTADPDGEIAHYAWTIHTPRGGTTSPADPDAELTKFVADQAGRYRVELTVEDDDGNTRSDTLYVDVNGDSSQPSAPPSSPSPPPAPSNGDSGTVSPIQNRPVPNQKPTGSIVGPDSVPAGSTGQYHVRASDQDGRIVDYWWLSPPQLVARDGSLKDRSSGHAYSFDVEPGTSVEVPVMLVDNDGAQSRVKKTVQVTNNQPTVDIEGDDTVTVGTVVQFEADANDVDGPITGYSWAADSPSVVKVDTTHLDRGTSSADDDQYQSFRFDAIPQNNATVSLSTTVRDGHGGSASAEKHVTVINQTNMSGVVTGPNPRAPPKNIQISGKPTNHGSEPVFVSGGIENPGQITFTATATDNDSDRLIYHWKFGERGAARTVESRPNFTSEVTYLFESQQVLTVDIPIVLTIEDESGRTATVRKTLTLKKSGKSIDSSSDLQIDNVEDGLVSGHVVLPTNRDGAKSQPSEVTLYFGNGESQNFELVERNGRMETRYEFSHRYRYDGEYTLYIYNENYAANEKSQATVNISKSTYTRWSYERKVKKVVETVSVESPGEEWKRSDVDHYVSRQTNTKTTTTPKIGGDQALSPGTGWKRIGTEVTYSTETRTERSTKRPGPNWNIAQREVGQKRVLDGWDSVVVPSKRLASDDWQFTERLETTVQRTQTRESVNEPRGAGWKKIGGTGEMVKTGSYTTWTSNTYWVDDSWEYIRSDRYVSHYQTSSSCVEYVEAWGSRYCAEYQTDRTPVYDYRYQYKVPEFEEVSEWERTVEDTTYEYKYRYPTYSTLPVNEYKKTTEVRHERAKWRRVVYEEVPVYEWTKTEFEWVEETSLSEPTTGTVRNVTQETKNCGDYWNPEEPQHCKSEGSE